MLAPIPPQSYSTVLISEPTCTCAVRDGLGPWSLGGFSMIPSPSEYIVTVVPSAKTSRDTTVRTDSVGVGVAVSATSTELASTPGALVDPSHPFNTTNTKASVVNVRTYQKAQMRRTGNLESNRGQKCLTGPPPASRVMPLGARWSNGYYARFGGIVPISPSASRRRATNEVGAVREPPLRRIRGRLVRRTGSEGADVHRTRK